MVFKFNDVGEIRLFREYFNPIPFAEAVGLSNFVVAQYAQEIRLRAQAKLESLDPESIALNAILEFHFGRSLVNRRMQDT